MTKKTELYLDLLETAINMARSDVKFVNHGIVTPLTHHGRGRLKSAEYLLGLIHYIPLCLKDEDYGVSDVWFVTRIVPEFEQMADVKNQVVVFMLEKVTDIAKGIPEAVWELAKRSSDF
jgi:hypothetical protein